MRDSLLYGLSSHNNPNVLLNNTGKEARKSQTFKCFRSPGTFVFVWMKLKGKLFISLPDITVCSFLGYTKDLIIVLTFLNPETKRSALSKMRLEICLKSSYSSKFPILLYVFSHNLSYLCSLEHDPFLSLSTLPTISPIIIYCTNNFPSDYLLNTKCCKFSKYSFCHSYIIHLLATSSLISQTSLVIFPL